MEFVELSDAEFRKFEQKNKCGNFFQSIERKELRSKMGWATHLLGVKEGNKVLAGGFLMMRDGNALVQLGPILNYEDKKVLRYVRKRSPHTDLLSNYRLLYDGHCPEEDEY